MRHRSKLVRLGLIGCGRVTETQHLPALQHLPDVEVVAVADIDPDRLGRVANPFRIEHRWTDYRALLDHQNVEAVGVCVPPQLHVEVALAALDAGKHLFIEKPLALSLDESERLIAQAAQSPKKVMVGFNMRWHRLVRQAREIIHRGDLGSPKLIRTALTGGSHVSDDTPEWRKRRELGGGTLVDVAVHHFDLWRFLLQTEVEEVFATSRSEQREDETATVMAQMSNGVLATSVFSQGTSSNHEIEVYGQSGRLHVSCYRFDGLEFFPTSIFPGDIRTRLQRILFALKELPQAALRARQGGDTVASYRAEWRHFINSIHHDTPVECTLEDGHRALQVVLAAAASASLRQPVKVAEGPRKITPCAPETTPESHQF